MLFFDRNEAGRLLDTEARSLPHGDRQIIGAGFLWPPLASYDLVGAGLLCGPGEHGAAGAAIHGAAGGDDMASGLDSAHI